MANILIYHALDCFRPNWQYLHFHSLSSFLKITRHLDRSDGHTIAIELERGKPCADPPQFPSAVLGTGPSLLRADFLQEKASREAYHKMFSTACELALNPQLPLSTFSLLINCQRMNGV